MSTRLQGHIYGLLPTLIFLIAMANAQSCTRVDDNSNTCYIDRTTQWKSSDGNITCDPSYSNCVITCADDKYACGSAEPTSVPFIIFTSANECVLNCNANEGCYGSIIHSMSCSTFSLNINGMAQNNMRIYAPDYGVLSVATLSEHTSFSYNAIYSGTFTSSIFMDCEMALKCTKNEIYAQWVTTQLYYACNSYCDSTRIYCPREANCDVRCQHSCNSLSIDGPTDLQQLSLVCEETECVDTSVACTINGTQWRSYFTESSDELMHGPCTVNNFQLISMSSSSSSVSLALSIYYNDSVIVTDDTDDAVLHSFAEILTQAFLDTYDAIRDDDDETLKVVFCSVFNRVFNHDCNSSIAVSTPYASNRQYRAQYMASGRITIECNADIDCTEYVRTTIASERFLASFDAEMNLKLFAIEEFTTIALSIDEQNVLVSVNEDDLLSEQMNESRQSQLMMIVIAIAMFSFIVCSFLCGYYIHVHFSAKKMARISKCSGSGSGGGDSDLVVVRKHPWNLQRLRSPKMSVLSKSSETSHAISDQSPFDNNDMRAHSRSIHWGFTNEHEKYGEPGAHSNSYTHMHMLHMQNNSVLSPGASSVASVRSLDDADNTNMECAAQLAYHMVQQQNSNNQCASRAYRLSVKQRVDQNSIPEHQVTDTNNYAVNVCEEEKVCLKGNSEDHDASTEMDMSSTVRGISASSSCPHHHLMELCPTFKLLPAQIPAYMRQRRQLTSEQIQGSESSVDAEELFKEHEASVVSQEEGPSTTTKPLLLLQSTRAQQSPQQHPPQHQPQSSLAVNVPITSPNSLTSVEKLDDDLDDYDFNECILPELNLNHTAVTIATQQQPSSTDVDADADDDDGEDDEDECECDKDAYDERRGYEHMKNMNSNTVSSLFVARRTTVNMSATSTLMQSDLSETSSETSETSQPIVQKRTKTLAVHKAVKMTQKRNRTQTCNRNRINRNAADATTSNTVKTPITSAHSTQTTLTTEPELPLSPTASTRYLSSPPTTLASLASPSLCMVAAKQAQMLQIPNRLQTQLPKVAMSSTSSSSSSSSIIVTNDFSSQYDDEKVSETSAPHHGHQKTDFSISQKIPSIYWDE